MGINTEMVKRAINGDRKALSKAFVWGDTEQGHDYWSNQYYGETPIDVDTLRKMIGEPVEKLKVGEVYTDKRGWKWECIFVRDGISWMMHHNDTAYQWNAYTGENISQDGGYYDIVFTERRNGSVEYVNGEPDFDTWEEDE